MSRNVYTYISQEKKERKKIGLGLSGILAKDTNNDSDQKKKKSEAK